MTKYAEMPQVRFKNEQQKPPLGIVPKWLWLQRRKEELLEAIERYYRFDPKNKMIMIWTQELSELTIELNKSIETFKKDNSHI